VESAGDEGTREEEVARGRASSNVIDRLGDVCAGTADQCWWRQGERGEEEQDEREARSGIDRQTNRWIDSEKRRDGDR